MRDARGRFVKGNRVGEASRFTLRNLEGMPHWFRPGEDSRRNMRGHHTPCSGWFKQGFDGRRHRFTIEECKAGYEALLTKFAFDGRYLAKRRAFWTITKAMDIRHGTHHLQALIERAESRKRKDFRAPKPPKRRTEAPKAERSYDGHSL